MVQPNPLTPTPPPTSGVVTAATPYPLPARGMRRFLLGWSPNLTHVLPDVVTFDAAAARAAHAAHAAALKVVAALPPFAPNPQVVPLTPAEAAWASQVTSDPAFLNAIGAQFRVGRIALDQLVVWQPFVDSVRADAAPLVTPDEIVRAMFPETPPSMPFKASLARDTKGTLHALLSTPDPSHDLDISVVDSGVTMRLRPRVNVVHVAPFNGNRFIVLNGYHRLVRLAAAGHVDAPVVINDNVQISDRPGFFPLGLPLTHPRPPLVTDFVNPALYLDVPRPEMLKAHDVAFTITELPI